MADSDILSQSEIDNLLASLTSGLATPEPGVKEVAPMPAAVVVEEVVSEDDKKGFKLYNFRRPDKFSKDHLRALQDIHKEFSRNLSLILTAYLRMHLEVDIVSVDQMTYDEFTRSMPSPMTIGILELNPLPGQVLLGISHEVVSSIVDRMLGGIGLSDARARELTDIEEALAKRVLERVTKTLETAWKSVFPVHCEVVGLDNNYSLIQIANAGEIIALITFEVQISSKFSGLMSLCFPFPVLEAVVGQLSSQHIFQSKGAIATSEDKSKILGKLNLSNINLNVILGDADITIQDFVDLKVGDVLRLNNSVNEALQVNVNNVPKFYAKPGVKNNNVAVSIVDIMDSPES